MENDFLKNMDAGQVREIVDSMYPREFEKGSYVIREGDAGKGFASLHFHQNSRLLLSCLVDLNHTKSPQWKRCLCETVLA